MVLVGEVSAGPSCANGTVLPCGCADGHIWSIATNNVAQTDHYNKDYFTYLQTDYISLTTLEGSSVLALMWPRGASRQPQASQADCSRPSMGSWLRWGELGLGGPLGLELLDGVECLVESESGCQ